MNPYLRQINSKKNKIILSKLRTSNHQLEIERGRYKKIPPENRFCHQCNLGEIEDELHFLLKCPKFENERIKFLDLIYSKFPNTRHLQTGSLFIWLMSAENVFVNKKLSQFVGHCMSLHIKS